MFHTELLLCVTALIIKEISSTDNSIQKGVSVSPSVNWFCSEGWTELNDGHGVTCLWLSSSAVNHVKAQSQCRTHGAALVKINSEEKIRAFKEKFPKFENEYWTGLRKERGYDASFMWDSLSGLRPANMSVMPQVVKDVVQYKQACVYLTTEGDWEIEECETEYYYICEKEIECKAGTYGEKCSSECHCLGEPCDSKSSTIRCKFGCEKGWIGGACNTEKQDPDLKYYCINSDEKGKYVNIRIYTKGVLYRSIYGLNMDKIKSPWCVGTSVEQDLHDLSVPVIITIPVSQDLHSELHAGTCAGEYVGNETYSWTLFIKENEGILLEHDLQVSIKCNFTSEETLLRSSMYSIAGVPMEVHKQSLDPQSTIDDVSMQVVNSYSGETITEASVGSSVVIQIKYGLKPGSLIKGVSPYNCKAMTIDKKLKKNLIDQDGCPDPGSPVSSFNDKVNNTIQTQWFPLFTFEGQKDVVFQCSFDLCFTDLCRTGCIQRSKYYRRSAEQHQVHSAERTVRVLLPGFISQLSTYTDPGAMPDHADRESKDNKTRFSDSFTENLLKYSNPIICLLFLLMFLVMCASFLLTLRRSVDDIRREVEFCRSRDQLLNWSSNNPMKAKDLLYQ